MNLYEYVYIYIFIYLVLFSRRLEAAHEPLQEIEAAHEPLQSIYIYTYTAFLETARPSRN